jgi:hypothetical protein
VRRRLLLCLSLLIAAGLFGLLFGAQAVHHAGPSGDATASYVAPPVGRVASPLQSGVQPAGVFPSAAEGLLPLVLGLLGVLVGTARVPRPLTGAALAPPPPARWGRASLYAFLS